MHCDRCGTTHLRCKGHKRTGEPCGSHPLDGHDKCRMHAGKKASDVKGQVAAERGVATYGLPVDVDPHDALVEELARTHGHVLWLGQVVAALEPESLTWGTSEQTDKLATEFPGVDVTKKAAPNTWLAMYQQERTHLVAVAKTAIAAGIDERRVQLAESQGQLIADVIRGVFGDLGVEITPEVAGVVRRHLALVRPA